MQCSSFARILLVAVIGLTGCQKSPGNHSAAELSGNWDVIAIEGDGEVATAEEVKGMTWSVVGNEITGTNPDGSTGKMSIRLNAQKSPKEINLTALDGNRQGQTDLGIYSIDQGVLRVSYAMDGERPQDFTPRGEGRLIVLKKVLR